MTTTKIVSDEEHIVEFGLGVGTPHWPVTEIENFLDALITATEAILELVHSWVKTKEALPGSQRPPAE